MTVTSNTNSAQEGGQKLRLVSFPEKSPEEPYSFLGFQFDASGTPEIVGEFVSVRDRFALIAFAEEALAKLKREAFNAAQVSPRASFAA
jgi:hypothetical protein